MLSFPSIYYKRNSSHHRSRLGLALKTSKSKRVSNTKMFIDEDDYAKAIAEFFCHDNDIEWNNYIKDVISEVGKIFELYCEAKGGDKKTINFCSENDGDKNWEGKGGRGDNSSSTSSSPSSDGIHSDINLISQNLKDLEKGMKSTNRKMNNDEKQQCVFLINDIIRSSVYSYTSKRPLLKKLQEMSESLSLYLFIK